MTLLGKPHYSAKVMCQSVGPKNFEPTFRNTLRFCESLSGNDRNVQCL